MAAKEENELFEIMSSYSEPNDSETQGSSSEPAEDDISETGGDRHSWCRMEINHPIRTDPLGLPTTANTAPTCKTMTLLIL
ncbi:unnamed protein product [Penicillium salamii]|nr:unnamed protein product [Penicillium salamii]